MNSGIYKIYNNLTKDLYVGSSHNIEKRWNTHLRDLRHNKHHCIPLQRAWNKYGELNFLFDIIELCNKENLIERENHYLRTYESIYNTAKDALAPMTGRKHSIKSKEQMSNRHRGNKYNLGKIRTEEQNKIRSEKRKQFKWSDEVKLKMSETSKRLNRYEDLKESIELSKRKIIDSNNIIHESLTAAAKYHSISIPTVCDILKGRHSKTRKKVSFKYV